MKLATRILALTALFACALDGPAAAAGVVPLKIEDAVGATTFQIQSTPALSPDNALVAYASCDQKKAAASTTSALETFLATGAAMYSAGCDIVLQPIAGGAPHNITGGAGANWGPLWSPDGRTLSFYSTRDRGLARLYVWDRAGGSIRQVSPLVTSSRAGFGNGSWLSDRRTMIVPLQRPRDPAAATSSATTAKPPADGSKPTLTMYRSLPLAAASAQAGSDEFVPMSDHDGDVDFGLVDTQTGTVKRVVTGVYGWTHATWLSPDGKKIAYLFDHGRRNSRSNAEMENIMVLDLQTLTTKLVAPDAEQETPELSWSPDSTSIAYTSGATKQTTSVMGVPNSSIFIATVADGTVRKLDSAPIFNNDFYPPLWDATGKFVYATDGDTIWRGDIATGSVQPVSGKIGAHFLVAASDGYRAWSPEPGTIVARAQDPRTKMESFTVTNVATHESRPRLLKAARYGGTFGVPIVSKDGRLLVYLAESADLPPDLWAATSSFTNDRRITTVSKELAPYTFGKSRLIQFTSAKGEALQATLLLPPHYQPGTKLPTVVWVYASDNGSRLVNYFGLVGLNAYNMQMLLTRGYAVLWPDIPVHTGTPMHDTIDAVVPAIDAAAAQGFVDSDRTAVMGQSNGGYSTLSLIVQTNRFKAAIMNAGFGDLTAFYAATGGSGGDGVWNYWLENSGGAMGVPPWENPQRYVDNSPVYYLDKITTPLIIQAGGADPAIVPFSDEVFSDLKRLHKDVTYLRYGGEGHVLEAYPNLNDYWNRVLPFLAEHLHPVQPN